MWVLLVDNSREFYVNFNRAFGPFPDQQSAKDFGDNLPGDEVYWEEFQVEELPPELKDRNQLREDILRKELLTLCRRAAEIDDNSPDWVANEVAQKAREILKEVDNESV